MEMSPLEAKMTGASVGSSKTAAQVKMENVRNLGKAAEDMVGTDNPKHVIKSLTNTAKRRYPDILTPEMLGEVKNVKHLNYTNQLKDFQLYSQKHQLQMNLYVRPTTTFSAPLQNIIDNKGITVIRINFK